MSGGAISSRRGSSAASSASRFYVDGMHGHAIVSVSAAAHSCVHYRRRARTGLWLPAVDRPRRRDAVDLRFSFGASVGTDRSNRRLRRRRCGQRFPLERCPRARHGSFPPPRGSTAPRGASGRRSSRCPTQGPPTPRSRSSGSATTSTAGAVRKPPTSSAPVRRSFPTRDLVGEPSEDCGAILVTSSSPALVVQSETSTAVPGGTVGQALPASAPPTSRERRRRRSHPSARTPPSARTSSSRTPRRSRSRLTSTSSQPTGPCSAAATSPSPLGMTRLTRVAVSSVPPRSNSATSPSRLRRRAGSSPPTRRSSTSSRTTRAR